MDHSTSPWRGRRVLVTGCTGFLGGAVVRDLLGRGAEVVGLVADRAAAGEFARHQLAGRVHVVHGRADNLFRVHSALAVYEARAVFHLDGGGDAATPTVVEAVRRFDPRVPVVVTGAVEPSRPPNPPTPFPKREGGVEPGVGSGSPPRLGEGPGEGLPAEPLHPSPPAPLGEWGATVPLGVARFGELFGGGDRDTTRPVPATILGLLAGDRPILPVDGPAREYTHVRDAARACVDLAEAAAARGVPHVNDTPFHAGWSLTDRGMAAAVREVFAGRPLQSSALADALAETIDWYRDAVRTRALATRPADPPHRAAA